VNYYRQWGDSDLDSVRHIEQALERGERVDPNRYADFDCVSGPGNCLEYGAHLMRIVKARKFLRDREKLQVLAKRSPAGDAEQIEQEQNLGALTRQSAATYY